MKVAPRRLWTVALFLIVTGWTASAENYQCRSASGCVATITKNGKFKKVRFRPGDVIDTETGWVAKSTDGWKKVKKKSPLPAGSR